MKLNTILNEKSCTYYACICCDHFDGCSIFKSAKKQFSFRVSERSFKCEFYKNEDHYPGREFKVVIS